MGLNWGETGNWRKLHNEELHNVYSSPNIIRAVRLWEDELDGACSMHGGEKICLRHVGGETGGKHFISKIQA